MNIAFRTRYDIEQTLLPRMFYANGAVMLLKMMGVQGDTIMSLYRQTEKHVKSYTCPYSEKEFLESHMVYRSRDAEILVVRVQMPEPESPLQSRAVYMCFDRNSEDQMFFTSEKMLSGKYCLCARMKDGAHLNFGESPLFMNDEFDLVADLFFTRNEYPLPKAVNGEGVFSP